jgi:hypothetical protein
VRCRETLFSHRRRIDPRRDEFGAVMLHRRVSECLPKLAGATIVGRESFPPWGSRRIRWPICRRCLCPPPSLLGAPVCCSRSGSVAATSSSSSRGGGGGIHHRTPSGRTVHTKDRRGWLLTGSELHRRSVLLPEPLVRIFSLLATSALLVRAGSTP